MVTCKECGCQFCSIWQEGYPGGAETGATLLYRAIIKFICALVLAVAGFVFKFSLLYIAGGGIALLGVLQICTIPENRRILIEHGGHKCPECGAANELRLLD